MDRKWKHTLIGGLLLAISPVVVQADSDGEKEALARLAFELKALEPIIQEAQAQADPEARVKFEYLWLRKDIHQIIQGIQDHIDGPRSEPRKFAPLRGDYRR